MTEFWEFRAGDAVPPWIIDVEPETPGGPRPLVEFLSDTVVVRTRGALWLLPAERPSDPHGVVFSSAGDAQVSVSAASEPVAVSTSAMTMYPAGDGPEGAGGVDLRGDSFPPGLRR